jgi:metal-responsive CopG/Arc/MetJ family transcriptional regulator
MAPNWRQILQEIMTKESHTTRISLRLPKELFEDIDRLRLTRAGNISRNTWIAEAVKEKLEKDSNLRIIKEQ